MYTEIKFGLSFVMTVAIPTVSVFFWMLRNKSPAKSAAIALTTSVVTSSILVGMIYYHEHKSGEEIHHLELVKTVNVKFMAGGNSAHEMIAVTEDGVYWISEADASKITLEQKVYIVREHYRNKNVSKEKLYLKLSF